MAHAGIGDRVEGFHAVVAALDAGRVRRLWVETSRLRHEDYDAAVTAARSGGVEVVTVHDVRPEAVLEPVETVGADYELDDDMLPVRGALTVGDLEMTWTAELHAPILLVSPEDKQSRFPRCTCKFETADGRAGRGWLEYNFPDGVPHLKS
jgi:hypothetical protein